MWRNYLKTTFRNLRRQVFYTLNNTIGLTLAFCAALYIFQYTSHEKHFDEHIPQRDHKVRLLIDKYRAGEKIVSSAETYVGCGPVLYEQVPEIEAYTRTFNMAIRMNSVISYEPENLESINLKLKDYYYADSSFLSFFGYELLEGNAATALAKPKTAVITESLAEIYFGNENPIGKILRYQDEDLIDDELVITGLMKDPPSNTHLPFRLLISYNTFDTRTYPGNYKTSWKARKSYTYFKLTPEASIKEIEAKLPQLMAQHKEIVEGDKEVLKLQPLPQVHFTADLGDEPVPTADKSIINFLEIVAILILVIACINFINLSTSSLISRSEEVGVRKILGARRRQLVLQYYFQCALINILAMLMAIVVLFLTWPYINNLAGSSMPVSVLVELSFLQIAGLMLVINTLLSGIIPSLIISSFDPIRAIAGKLRLTSGNWYRLLLITGQFTISFCLIMCTLVVFKQLKHMQNQDMGVDMEQVLVVRVPGILKENDRIVISGIYEQFMNEGKEHASIAEATSSLTIPGHERAFRTGVYKQSSPDQKTTLRFNASGPSFVSTYNMEILAGRNFKPDSKYDLDSAILLSSSAVKALGFESNESALGALIKVPAFRLTCEVVGVVNDYRLESVKTEAEPMAFLYFHSSFTNFFSFKLDGKNAKASIDHLTQVWNQKFPGNPIDYFFLNDFFNRQYTQEQKLTRLFGAFGVLAIILASMGLLGLAAHIAQQRTKEIGIRKTLGSSVFQIFRLLSARFVVMVIIASIVGIPLIYYFSAKWLNQFPVQTSVSFWLYLIPVFILLLATLLSTGIQTMKAALTNPVKALRHQ